MLRKEFPKKKKKKAPSLAPKTAAIATAASAAKLSSAILAFEPTFYIVNREDFGLAR